MNNEELLATLPILHSYFLVINKIVIYFIYSH